MKSTTLIRPRTLCISLVAPTVLLAIPASAEGLDDLLKPTAPTAALVDDSATESWNGVVDAFRRNDLVKARELGAAFLDANHKTSPYQVLGVRVMIDLANAENPAVTRDVALTGEMKRLMAERDSLRAKYVNLQRVVHNAEALINKLTSNRTVAVQSGTAAYRECARAAQEIAQANAEMEAMKPAIDANKEKVGKVEVGANENLKSDTLKLLDMLIEADEIEAAFAITNVFTRVAGSDLDVAKKQQDVIHLREDREKADKIVSAITGEIDPLVAAGKGEEAQSRLEMLVTKVETSGQSESVKKLATTELKALGLKVVAARKAEQRKADAEATAKREEEERAAMAEQRADREADMARADKAAAAGEINDRLTTLETKLEKAQETFGSVIRSIEGFSDFTGDFKAEADKKKMAATLNTKLRSGQVSKEKVDNLVKAKAEHVGILREVEVLQSNPAGLSVIQKGRLANLQGTAQTALDLLKEANP